MRVLRLGSKDDEGSDVHTWQWFLVGLGYRIKADGVFGRLTTAATIAFQRREGLTDDGIVGNATWGKAMQLGLPGSTDGDLSEASQDWPPPPPFHPLSVEEKVALFGKFSYVIAPTSSSPEAIRVVDGWGTKNLQLVEIPQLKSVLGAPSKVQLHHLVVDQVLGTWKDWDDAGLLSLIKSWDGSYAPRLVRGSTSTLSSHAWGTGFDVNARWNPMGTIPALVGSMGSVRKLVPAANGRGLWWGGHFKGRKDGMHFEVAVLP